MELIELIIYFSLLLFGIGLICMSLIGIFGTIYLFKMREYLFEIFLYSLVMVISCIFGVIGILILCIIF